MSVEARGEEPAKFVETERVRSSLYNLQLTILEGPFDGFFGAIALRDGEVLVATVDGTFYAVSEGYEIGELELSAPVDATEFNLAVPDDLDDPFGAEAFGVKDIYLREVGEQTELYVSHSYWDTANRCAGLRLSMTLLSLEGGLSEARTEDDWQTLYDSQPCLPLKDTGIHTHAGHQAGGRIGALRDGTILLTIGDHEFDGLDGLDLVQDPSSSYGKVIKLAPGTWKAEVFSTGHRNPQGLYISPDGQVWSTEHGPCGGDELNRLVEGEDYGWPNVTYGVAYTGMTWPLSHRQGSHEGYALPVYAWVPSIGVSNLVGVERPLFDLWAGDLLVSSLKYETLYRLRIREDRIIFAETIWIEHRIRDIGETDDGAIVMKTDDDLLIFMTPAPPEEDDEHASNDEEPEED